MEKQILVVSYFGKETFNVKKRETDKEGRILILDVSVNDSEYILINLYNANTEKEQINVFSNMFALLKKFDINKKTCRGWESYYEENVFS